MAMRTRYRWVALLIAVLQFAPAALGQGKQDELQKPSAARPVPLIIEKGVPLQISLEKAIPVKREGILVQGRLVRPIYVFDQMIIPAGSQVLGSVSRVDRVSRARRLEAIANGNFTPLRTAHLEFDTVILNDGRRIPVRTLVSQGAPHVVHLSAGSSGKKKGRLREKVAQAREEVKARERQGLEDVRSPGKLKRIEAALATELPYHRQFLPVGTQFTAVLQTPLEMGSERIRSKDLTQLGSEIDPGSVVHVRLLTPLSSATDRRGAIVEAMVSQPVYSTDHQLILPQGTQLQGRVTEAAPARHFGRNGRLRFTFRQIDLPGVAPRQVVATLQGVDARSSAHLKVDTEGGVQAVTPRTRYIAPAIDVVLATSSLDGLDPHRRLHPHFTQGPDVAGGFIRGGAGLGLVGSVVGITAHYRPVSAVFAFYAAGWSVYSHLIVRGTDVVFPVNTPMEILFGKREPSTSAGPHTTPSPQKPQSARAGS